MKLGLIISNRCNARCTHCSTSCGPSRSDHLPDADIFELMNQAVRLAQNQLVEFLLSGGEPFLDLERLLHLVRHGHSLGAGVTCVTNGYWAASDAKARALLGAVREAGLNVLAVSTSRFHQQFVNKQRVERVLRLSREIGLPCALKYARTASDAESPDEVQHWATAAGAHTVQDFPIIPYLSAGASLPDDDYLRQPGLPEGGCPAALLTVREDGEAFMCPQPGAQNPLLALGNAQRTGLARIRSRHYLGGAQQLLRNHGPIHFAREIQARGLSHRLRAAYAGVCDLCAHIASDPEMAVIAAECAQTYAAEQLSGIADVLVEPSKLHGEVRSAAGRQ
ncbi:MAG: radical SAM protein [Sinimarinibacterium sp.]|jgi:hypothetical protein